LGREVGYGHVGLVMFMNDEHHAPARLQHLVPVNKRHQIGEAQ
jgi:hypothetical protein